jgi:DNA-binding NarL/FixJ family response regulator
MVSGGTVRPRLLVVDDDEIIIRTTRRVLRDIVDVIGATTTAEASCSYTQACGLIIDICLPDGNGLDFLSSIRTRGCIYPAMVLTGVGEDDAANRAFDCDAAYCEKPILAERLRRFGRLVADPSNARIVAGVMRWSVIYRLTHAEQKILMLAATGLTREQIALDRGVTPETIKSQAKRLLEKTGDAFLVAAALRCVREAPK